MIQKFIDAMKDHMTLIIVFDMLIALLFSVYLPEPNRSCGCKSTRSLLRF